MIDRSQIYEKLATVFEDVFDDENIELQDSTSAKDVLEWDSMHHINLVLLTEQEFGIKFTTAEVARLANVGEFVDLIINKLN